MTAALLKSLRDTVDLRHLRQIIVGLDEGVIGGMDTAEGIASALKAATS